MVHIFKNKKKYIMCMALASTILTTTGVHGLDYKAVVIAPEVIVRQENVFDSKELDKLNIGTQITVKEVIDNWYKVELPNGEKEGWISAEEVIINDKSYSDNKLKKGEVTASALNVRLGPSTTSGQITQVKRGEIVTIINTSKEWYEVVLSNNMKGWVHSDYIKITYNLPNGKINANDTVLRDQPKDTAANILVLKSDEIVYIKDYMDNWYNVVTSSHKEGWIDSKHVSILTTDKDNINRSGSSRDVFSNIKTITEKYLGRRYVSGGNGPNGFDCSGFTSYILKTYYSEYLNAKGFAQFPRTATGQSNIGTKVDRENLQEGDLVFFDTSGRIGDNIGHVGIYIGNGQIIHASTSRGRIVIDQLSDRYYSTRYMGAIRL